MTARDDAGRAGKAAARVLASAERAILAAMAREAAPVIRGDIPPLLARRKFSADAAVEFGRASAALRDVYARAVRDATGQDGPLPDAPGQVATAILRAQQDADVAFGAVLAAALGPGKGVRMPPPSSPYRRIVTSARRHGTPGKAAAAALDAIGERGLTGWVSYAGRRQEIAAHAGSLVRSATSRLAREPVLSEIAGRRDALLAAHARTVSAAWNRVAGSADMAGAVAAYRADSRVTSAATDPGVRKRWQREAAANAALTALSPVYQAPGYPGLVAALEAMTLDGMTEGQADAMAFAAYRQKAAGFSITTAFTTARARLAGNPDAARQAQETAARITQAAARHVARAIDQAGDGEAEEEAREALTGRAGDNAVSRWVDYLLWAAFGAGAMALYRKAAAQQFTGQGVMVDWITAEDNRVCPACQRNEDDSPYPPDQVPSYPAHSRCRCVLDSDDASMSAWLMNYYFG